MQMKDVREFWNVTIAYTNYNRPFKTSFYISKARHHFQTFTLSYLTCMDHIKIRIWTDIQYDIHIFLLK